MIGVSHDLVFSWMSFATLVMDGDGMTQEEYIEILKELVSLKLVEDTKDWSVSDRMYVFLHYIQLQEMEDIKELLKMVLRK